MDKKEKHMKTRRNVIILFSIIAVFAVGIIIVNNIDVSENNDPVNGGDAYTILAESAEEIADVTVKTDSGEIKAVNLGDAVWTINDMSTDDIDTSKAYALAGTVASLTSKNIISEDPADLSEYGLDAPSVTVTVTKKNGGADKLYIGDLSPTLGEYFIMTDSSPAVYTIFPFKVETLCRPLEYYREFDRFKIDIDDITAVSIARSDETIQINIIDDIDVNTNNVWEMTAPYKSGANDDYIDDKILEPLDSVSLTMPVSGEDSGITSSSPVLTLTVRPYDNNTGKYGDEYTEKLVIGKTFGDETYVEYKNQIYKTAAESVGFVNDSAFNIVSKLQALVDISDVKRVDVSYGGETHKIEVSHRDNKYMFKLDGKEADSDISQNIYQSIMALAVDSVYDGGEIKETPLLTISFEGVKNEYDTVVEIKPIDDINCALIRNGEVNFTLKKRKVEEFINLFKEYVNDPMSE